MYQQSDIESTRNAETPAPESNGGAADLRFRTDAAYAFADYWARAGWSPIPSPVPTPANKQKKPAIAGVSGWQGIDVDEDLAHMLAIEDGHCNVGLRMKRGMLGIDIDAYHGGLETLTAREAEWGPLPKTIYSTNRDDGSDIRYFRVPVEMVTVGNLGQWGPGIDLIQRHHRFAVVAGRHWSGRYYRIGWQSGCQFPQEPDQLIWRPNQAAKLPDGWVQGLRKAARQQQRQQRRPRQQAQEQVRGVSTAGQAPVLLIGLLKYVERAPEGERNSILFWAGCRAFEDPDRLSIAAVSELLRRAASVAGLPDSESLPTIASARWTVAE